MSKMNSLSAYVQIDDQKLGRVEVQESTTVAQLRISLITRFGPLTNTHFLDTNNYPLHIQDEYSTNVREVLNENGNIIRLKTNIVVTFSDVKSNALTKKSEPILPAISLETSSLEVPLPGTLPTLTKSTITVATQLDSTAWKQIFANCNLFSAIRMDEETLLHAFRPVLKFKDSCYGIPLFLVNDTSYIRSYMKNKRLQSAFGASKFFDGGLDPCTFFGINSEFSKRKGTTNEERTVYSTCSFNFPRVTVQLDSSYLEPTAQFIEAIDHVLELTSSNEQISALKKIFAIYGHVYPRRIILGGHLYHTEGHRIKGTSEEQGKLIAAETRFSISLTRAVRIGSGFHNEKKSKEDFFEQETLSMFEAVGGDTLVSRDPTLWAKSVADPTLWRVIEYHEFESVVCLLTQQRQNALTEIIGLTMEQLSKKDTKVISFHGDGTPYDTFNNFVLDFQRKLKETQDKIKYSRGSSSKLYEHQSCSEGVDEC
ncbi:hypothetical protein I4U23_001384 [Adineta vaga]|nr:hypothetical protein I4U23_001384 [Adineta vaga]